MNASLLEESGLRPLTLLVHPDMLRLQREVEMLHASHSWPILSLGQNVGRAVVPLPERRRAAAAQHALEDAVRSIDAPVILCADLAPLCDRSLHLDPLSLLLRVSIERTLVVAWPGRCQDATLSYALPEHAHYRTWPQPAAGIFLL